MRFLYLMYSVSFAVGSELSLFARNIDTNDRLLLQTFDYNAGTAEVSAVALPADVLPATGSYCVDATFNDGTKDFPCFSYLEISDPLHYDLIVHLHGNNINKLSLVYNPEAEGIVASIRHPVKGPEPPAIKLKKVTKTYKDKNTAKKAATAQFEEDVELDNRSWMQKNWKMLLIGLVVYNVIAYVSKQQKPQQE